MFECYLVLLFKYGLKGKALFIYHRLINLLCSLTSYPVAKSEQFGKHFQFLYLLELLEILVIPFSMPTQGSPINK